MKDFVASFRLDHSPRGQHLCPVIADDRRLAGVMTRKDIHKLLSGNRQPEGSLEELARPQAVVAYPDEPLRVIVYRMAETGFTRLPVVDSSESGKIVGLVSLEDLLRARTRNLTEERHRERVLRIRPPFGSKTERIAG